MKILFLAWKSFGNKDMMEAFLRLGCEVKEVPFSNEETRNNPKLEAALVKEIREYEPDFVFSFNYFPVVSLACKACDIAYVSWTYDSPSVQLYSYTILYPKNYVFVFDREMVLEYQRAGINTVYYLPLAANPERLSSMKEDSTFLNGPLSPRHAVSFVGSLYNEKHNFFDRLEGIMPYTRGYLEGLMAAQKQVYGYHFMQEALPREIIEDMRRFLPLEPSRDGIESIEYLFAQYVLSRRLTGIERMEYLTDIAGLYGLDLYTPNQEFTLPGCDNHGPVDDYSLAPYVYRHSRININITLRSIKSGIPLRAFDIIGAGGFLLSNYQNDFSDCFTDGLDYVSFDSKQDLLEKLHYYTHHEAERAAIADSGYRTLCSRHTYLHRAKEMLSYLS